jgi:vitamin B12 transporter
MRKTTLLACSVLAAAAPAFADTVETVVVSASRSEQPLAETGVSISVLTGEDLAERQSVFLTDALAATPGLTVNRAGGPGQLATVSLRGAEQGQTVTLIDGIRLNDPSDVSGGSLYGDLVAANIERIEVLRGPQSTLYGGSAIGGVVNIVTRRGGDRPFALTASAEAGTQDSWRLNAAANGTAGGVEYGAALDYSGTKGISAADSRAGNREADGYRNLSATVNTRTHLADTISLDLRGYASRARSEFDDGYDAAWAVADSAAYGTHSLYAGYAGLNGDFLGGRFKNHLALIGSFGKRDDYDSSYYDYDQPLNYSYSGNASRIEYQGIFDADADTRIVFGAETELSGYRNANFTVYEADSFASGGKRISGGYGQIQHTLFDALTLTAGVRHDSDEEFGSHTSVKFAAAWQLPEWDTTLRANYGDGFKAPTLYQLYSPYSNPIAGLKPETARGWEAGIDKGFYNGRLQTSLTYFERRTKNQIDFQSCYSAADAPGCAYRLAQYGYYVNIGRTKAEGIEASLTAAITDTLRLTANYTNMSAIDRSSGLDLARRPHVMANAAVNWRPLPELNLSASANFIGKRFDDAAETVPLGAKPTVDLFGDYALDETWQLYGRIDNIFNDRTERIAHYGAPGIAASIGVRAHL